METEAFEDEFESWQRAEEPVDDRADHSVVFGQNVHVKQQVVNGNSPMVVDNEGATPLGYIVKAFYLKSMHHVTIGNEKGGHIFSGSAEGMMIGHSSQYCVHERLDDQVPVDGQGQAQVEEGESYGPQAEVQFSQVSQGSDVNCSHVSKL